MPLVSAAVLSAACANHHESGAVPAPANPDSPIVREGTVYTPAGIDSQGCMRFSVRIPGGHAPAALVYLSADGRFSYGRPERCVKKAQLPIHP